MWCDYRNAFGKVRKGVHSIRVLDMALVDVACTVTVAYLLHRYHAVYGFVVYLIVLILSGIIAHRLFCVRTTVDKWLFQQVK